MGRNKPPAAVRDGWFEGITANHLHRHVEHIQTHSGDAGYRDKLVKFLVTRICPDCDGTRLRPEDRSTMVQGRTVDAVSLPLFRGLGGRIRAGRNAAGRDGSGRAW
ncbi:MAG: hypothetical protein ACOX8W_03680 [bacterium]